MKAVLQKMSISNFKGIGHIDLDFRGMDVVIYGKNATGKSTVFDAFTWALFGKNSGGDTDFWVKPHDANGNECHNLETSVSLLLKLDGKREVTFTHAMSESWVKKNGQADRVFSGNKHMYWVNEVAQSAADYEKNVAKIVGSEVFRLITNPMAFNSIGWDKRRESLLRLSQIDIDSIMLAKPEYQAIGAEMQSRGTDIYGLRKVKKEQKDRSNEELGQIPVRISELSAVLNGFGDCDTAKAEERMKQIDAQIAAIEEQMSAGNAIIEVIKAKSKALADAEAKRSAVILALTRSSADARAKANTELVMTRSKVSVAKSSLSDIEERIKRTDVQIEAAAAQIESFRTQWYQIDDEKASEYDGITVCPACGQNLPKEQIEVAVQKHIRNFEEDKERRLTAVSSRGQTAAEDLKAYSERKAKDTAEADKLRKVIADTEPLLAGLEAEVIHLNGEVDYSGQSDVVEADKVIAERREAYEAALTDKKPIDEELSKKKQELRQERDSLAGVAAAKNQRDVCETRIHSLESRQEELGVQVADIERFLMTIDHFVSERCKALEESVNSMFPSVRWKLFDVQINGGIKDCCDCLVGGVKFSDANNAAKINAGLEIIDVLSRHYEASVPVFIDNAEAVNELNRIGSQRIALVVTQSDATMRVEYEIMNNKEVR